MARILHPPLPIISAKYIGCTWIIKGGGGSEGQKAGQRGIRGCKGRVRGIRGYVRGVCQENVLC